MDFIEARFRGLPWQITEDSLAFGDDLVDEIEESFQLIADHADLTFVGEKAIQHIRRLFQTAMIRWRCIKSSHRQAISHPAGKIRMNRSVFSRNVIFPLLRVKQTE